MAKPESGLWDYLRARMPVGAHFSRVESPDTCPGFPDVDVTFRGTVTRMELKCNEFPNGNYPFSDDKHGLRRSQKLWIRDNLDAGGRVILVLQYKHKVYFLGGTYAQKLHEMEPETIDNYAMLIWDRVHHDARTTDLIPLLTAEL